MPRAEFVFLYRKYFCAGKHYRLTVMVVNLEVSGTLDEVDDMDIANRKKIRAEMRKSIRRYAVFRGSRCGI